MNQVGGQDDLIFDGSSFVSNHNGQLALQAPSFQESVYFAEYDAKQKLFKTAKETTPPPTLCWKFIRHWSWQPVTMCSVQASWVILGYRVVLTLLHSPLQIAVDAIGADKVQAVMMPYTYTSQMSVEDATEQARRMV